MKVRLIFPLETTKGVINVDVEAEMGGASSDLIASLLNGELGVFSVGAPEIIVKQACEDRNGYMRPCHDCIRNGTQSHSPTCAVCEYPKFESFVRKKMIPRTKLPSVLDTFGEPIEER